ncbi:hypothetical protein [Flavobacterium agrisoli]|uniref:Uncharacterized protein n=1 Tax=Flavobacterium agrisoli TaxID=2793066 RepID=A0A934PND3_9FLAO|nr:hypothetical protein [Flavobacterium agrisoli]MBK0369666.1 hypothetical protein [Flavobacterium agrisoli]
MIDIGDGKGTFRPVESDIMIEFKNDGTVLTNSFVCDPYGKDSISTGNFNLDDSTITTNCNNPNFATIRFELKNQFLILNFNSNEGHSKKFKKMN